jgi:hypothetical protein
MTICRPVPLVFSREEIDAGLSCTHLRWLNALLAPRSAHANRQRLVLGFSGFNGQSERLFEIPAVRAWMREIDQEWPYWFFFLDPQSSLFLLMLLLCPLERTTYELQLHDSDYQHFVQHHLAAMEAVCTTLADPSSTRTAMKESIRHALL